MLEAADQAMYGVKQNEGLHRIGMAGMAAEPDDGALLYLYEHAMTIWAGKLGDLTQPHDAGFKTVTLQGNGGLDDVAAFRSNFRGFLMRKPTAFESSLASKSAEPITSIFTCSIALSGIELSMASAGSWT